MGRNCHQYWLEFCREKIMVNYDLVHCWGRPGTGGGERKNKKEGETLSLNVVRHKVPRGRKERTQ